LADELVELADLVVGLARADPEGRRRASACRDGDGHHAHAIDRALRDRITRQLAVLRVAPRPLLARRVLLADRERRQAIGASPARPGEQEVAPALVVDERLSARVVIRRITGVVPVQVRVEVLEQPRFAVATARVLDGDFLEIQVAVEIDGVTQVQDHAEPSMRERGVANERLVLVRDAPLPAIVAAPRELAVDPDPESGWVTDGVVLEADVGIENVAELVTSVEGDEEVAVPEREIARHRELLVRGRAPGRGEEALGVRDHARDVPPFDEIRADEWSADPETDHAGGEVLRNVLEVDIPRR